jgi:hypothetical protein
MDHARRELRLAGLLGEEGVDAPIPGVDYGGAHALAALELVEVFAGQGHSGGSAGLTLHLFHELANYRTLTRNDHSDHRDMSEAIGKPAGSKALLLDVRTQGRWQSNDGGETWVDVETQEVERARDGVIERYATRQAMLDEDARLALKLQRRAGS